jgi:selenocysteine lyase/cysteine desulfurase
MGNPDAPRLSIMSLRFKHGDKDLHYGFVVSLLNDLFGIQVRGGCSCAGPYGHTLLGMRHRDGRSELVLSDNAEHLRWFVLPQNVAAA